MSEKFDLAVELRGDVGKGASRRLRRLADLVPGVLYGGNEEPTMISLSHNSLKKKLEDEAFAFSIIKLKIGDKVQQAVVKDLQRHPSQPKILHIDFLRITGKEKITMHVPLHYVGEDAAPGVKDGGGVISHLMSDIEIKCLPKDLPEYIEVDVSQLELGSTLHLSDIKLPAGVTLAGSMIDEEHNLPIFNIHVPKRVVIEEEAAPVSPEVPTVGEGEEKEAEE